MWKGLAVTLVNVDNYVRAETAAMFDAPLAMAGGINRWIHLRVPAPVDQQTVIRMNRDTLYSGAIVDISGGGTVTLPDVRGRYMTLMVINEDHYINRVFSEPGTHELSVEDHDTPFVMAGVRILVDANDPDDIAEVNRLQDRLILDLNSQNSYIHPEYDLDSFKATKDALLALGEGVPDTTRTFGSESEVDPIRHLIGTATRLGVGCRRPRLSTTWKPAARWAIHVHVQRRPRGRFLVGDHLQP